VGIEAKMVVVGKEKGSAVRYNYKYRDCIVDYKTF
jgi:hypothetical protein